MATKAKTAKATIVLLHGLGGCEDDWAETAAILEKSATVRVPSLPWSGRDPQPAKGCDPSAGAAHVARELAGLGPVVVAGQAYGARVAGELMVSQGALLQSVVLVSPLGAVKYSFTDRLKWKGMSRGSVLRSVPDTSMKNAASYGFTGEGSGKKAFVERALAFRKGPKADGLIKAMEQGVDGLLEAPPLLDRLKGTKTPLLVIAGQEDPLAPADESKQLLKARADARYELLAGAGHYPMIEDPKTVAKLIAAFLG